MLYWPSVTVKEQTKCVLRDGDWRFCVPDEPSDPFGKTMGVVERLAAKIVEMPLERRPEGFMALREMLVEAAKEMKLEGTKLNEFVNHSLSAVETLVRNEDGGGAGEGHP